MRSQGYNSCSSCVAAFACGVIGFLLSTPMRLSGLLFIIIIDHFEVDRFHATIPIVLFGVTRSLSGPFTGYLGQVFGLRAVTLFGCILTTVGVGSCFFAEDLKIVNIFLGCFYGIGFGLGFNLAPTILKQHFNKNFNLVNGFYMTGTCLSPVIMPPVIAFLIGEYGYSAMFLLLSGIILNSVPFSILLKDPKNDEYHLKVDKQNNRNYLTIVDSQNCHPPQYNNVLSGEDNLKELDVRMKIPTTERISYQFSETVHACLESGKRKGVINPCFSSNEIHPKQQILCLNFEVHQDNMAAKSNFQEQNDDFIKQKLNNKMECESVDRVKEEHISNSKPINVEKNWQISMPTEIANSKNTSDRSLRRSQFLLFLEPTFLIQVIIQSLQAFNATLSWTILIDFARDKGIAPEKAVYFLTYITLAEVVGNLSFNWICDRGYLSRTNYCAICFLILSADNIYLVLAASYASILVAVLISGCIAGTLWSTFPGIINDFIEEDQQAMGMSSRFLLYAVFCACKSPVIGYFRETLGSYNGVFYVMATGSLVNAMLSLLTPVLANLRNKRKLKMSKN